MNTAEVFAAITSVTKALGRVGKGAFNQHGNYRFVSIDKYYETAGVEAANAGLTWVLKEDSFEVVASAGPKPLIKATYIVDLFHSSGATLPGFSKLSIIHPIQGAQTVGSAMSYADKVFMRQLFKVATGEEDADSTNPSDLDYLGTTAPSKPASRPSATSVDPMDFSAPVPAPKPAAVEPKVQVPVVPDDVIPGEEGNWDQVKDIFLKFMPNAKTMGELRNFWSENVKALDAMKESHPTVHAEVLAAFTARKAEINKEKK